MLLRDQNIWFGAYDLTTTMNSVGIVAGRETLDKTVFTNQSRQYAPGLKTVTGQAGGFFEAVTYDQALYDALGVVDTPFSVADSAQTGAVAYSFKAMEGDYSPIKNSVGELLEFSAGAVGTGDLIRGQLAMKGVTITADGNSTPFQLGALASGKKLYAVVHVTRKSGTNPTLDLLIKSDNAQGFSSPLTRITVPQFTAIGTQWVELAGPVTDDWYRVDYDLGGTSPSFDFSVILAIQ